MAWNKVRVILRSPYIGGAGAVLGSCWEAFWLVGPPVGVDAATQLQYARWGFVAMLVSFWGTFILQQTKIRQVTSELESQQVEKAQRIGRADWQRLADDFKSIPGSDVRADWQQDDRGERLELRGGPSDVRNFEPFCRLAGEMLSRSPRVYPSLSGHVRAQEDPLQRWLVFITEYDGGVKSLASATHEHRDGTKTVSLFGSVRDIKAVSIRACVHCWAKET